MRVPEKKEPSAIEKEQAKEGFYPTRWWVAAEADTDEVLAESSDPNDWVFRDLLKQDNVVIYRVYEKKIRRIVVERPDTDE